jgi:hypothetical protein
MRSFNIEFKECFEVVAHLMGIFGRQYTFRLEQVMEDLVPIASRKKKVVHYHELQDCKVGCRALVWPIDHPAIPDGAYGRTTAVQSFDPRTGVVETLNTRYEPGIFAQWTELRKKTPTELTYDLYTLAPSMPLPLQTKLNEMA